jgi:hypothetical protein
MLHQRSMPFAKLLNGKLSSVRIIEKLQATRETRLHELRDWHAWVVHEISAHRQVGFELDPEARQVVFGANA